MTGLAERIRACAERVGGGDALARKTGIPRSTLETYLTGKAEPKASRIAEICEVSGVNTQWLLTGTGPMQLNERGTEVTPSHGSAVDSQLLELVIERLETKIAATGKKVSAKKKAELVTLLYDYIVETGKAEGPSVERILRLVA
ncbi:helix-turn-helix domain-containing protein [Cupriavidus gilardii]|uniref:helix-turn-helix domain-containing protein n=1 Tax=Cupriavidus gilardii TaxID=82541 RepID=UPI0021B2CDE0|nr:helix-turn-helix domain-containing protein [Cupriavidus gilardii]MCT9072797.1 helix-turn-helix domain-containing protein [Cupriavidus gilardii]UXC35124.1 helix-turn-helix domain-containing protein [Cupriavidus gilardii]